jgi:RNA polymerase sigma-70 factor (ECF subfamily)
MLQTVLGIDAVRIAAAFVTTPSAMAQRLVRAKVKIRDAGIRFEVPDPSVLSTRLPDVLQAVYAAYGTGWDEAGDAPLAEEAIFLARLLRELLPAEPEIAGLLALFLHCEARKPARRSPEGAFVPLADQDCRLWSGAMIEEAEALLTAASRSMTFGRFQTEAAIQSVHAQRATTGRTDLGALVLLHDLLAERAPSLGALVSRAAVHGEAFGPEAGLRALNALPDAQIQDYQPYWAVRTHLLRRAGHDFDAARARAIALSPDPAIRDHLARISPSPHPSAAQYPPIPPRTE